jgi:hypothetical protein
MVDLRTAVELHGFGRDPVDRPELIMKNLIGPGLVDVDYGDPEHVFLVTVTRVPRVHLPTGSPSVAELDGVQVRLVDVELANHVTVVLEGAGPLADQQSQQYAAAFEAWAAAGGRDGEPPSWPAERLADLPYRLSDDVGTVYRMSSGEAGGGDHPWRSVWHHLPTPPSDARLLRIEFAGVPAVELRLPPPG